MAICISMELYAREKKADIWVKVIIWHEKREVYVYRHMTIDSVRKGNIEIHVIIFFRK